jgi:hypothetical protein
MMREAEFMAMEGLFDEALTVVDDMIQLSGGDDAMSYVIQASILAQEVWSISCRTCPSQGRRL